MDIGQTLQLNVSRFASESNAPTLNLAYSLGSGAPSGASINPTTGAFTWPMGINQQIGTYPITVQVSDHGSPPQSAATTFNVNVVDPGPAPTISVAKVSTKKGVSITLSFSQPVNPETAGNSTNYILTEPAKKKPKSQKKLSPLPIRIGLSVSYNPSTHQVILKGPKKLKISPALMLTVVGTGPNGIAKVDGLQLAGTGQQPGTNYLATVTAKAVNPTSAVVGNTIVARSAKGHTDTDTVARPKIVRHGSAETHSVKVASTRPAGPMAFTRTPLRNPTKPGKHKTG